MAKFECVSLVAVERGFRDGALIEPGAAFVFTGDKLPKWAAPADEAAQRLAAKNRRVAGDLKPASAQVEVRKKASALGAG